MSIAGPSLTIIGGGVSVTTLVDLLAERSELRGTDLRLVGHDPTRTAHLTRHLAARLANRAGSWTVRGGTGLAELVRGSDVVVVMARVGGSAARAYDETFPTRWNLVGDEGLGPGGIANAWRTVPVVREIARVIRSAAPDATVLDLVAPLGVTTRAFVDVGVSAIGLCELPSVTMDRLGSHVERATQSSWHVAGLNHLSWIWPSSDDETGDGLRNAARTERLVDDVTWGRFGAVPLPYYYRVVQPELGRGLGVTQPAGRAAELATLSTAVLSHLSSAPGDDLPELCGRPTPWFDRAVVPAVVALVGGTTFDGTANVVNGSLLDWLPADVVVEVPAMIDGDGVTARSVAAPPAAVARFLAAWADVERCSYEAAVSRRAEDLGAAVDALPLPLPPETGGIVDAIRAGDQVAV